METVIEAEVLESSPYSRAALRINELLPDMFPAELQRTVRKILDYRAGKKQYDSDMSTITVSEIAEAKADAIESVGHVQVRPRKKASASQSAQSNPTSKCTHCGFDGALSDDGFCSTNCRIGWNRRNTTPSSWEKYIRKEESRLSSVEPIFLNPAHRQSDSFDVSEIRGRYYDRAKVARAQLRIPQNSEPLRARAFKSSTSEPVRNPLSLAEKKAKLAGQEHKCIYCGESFNSFVCFPDGHVERLQPRLDHFEPWVLRHNNEPENFFGSCQVCNNLKSDHVFDSLSEARKFLNAKRRAEGYTSGYKAMEFKTDRHIYGAKN
jgi:5-methylcytosine-specific restriction endonuclease McrA